MSMKRPDHEHTTMDCHHVFDCAEPCKWIKELMGCPVCLPSLKLSAPPHLRLSTRVSEPHKRSDFQNEVKL